MKRSLGTQFRLGSPTARAAAIGLLLSLGLAACKLPIEVNGDVPDPDNIGQVTPGKSTKADVTRLMGSPSSTSTFDPNTWYYASRRVAKNTFGDSSLVDQTVYVVKFDDKGMVSDFQTHINDPKNVTMIARSTPAPGKELSFLEQMLGNFGKFTNNSKKKDEDEGGGS